MNKTIKTLALVGVTTAALGVGGAALADRGGKYGAGCGDKGGEAYGDMRGGHGGRGGHGVGGEGRGMMQRLGLDEGQRAAMAQLRESYEPRWTALRERMQANHEAMRSLRGADTFDAGQFGVLADERGALIAEQMKLRSEMRTAMQALLTDEQRERLRNRGARHL